MKNNISLGKIEEEKGRVRGSPTRRANAARSLAKENQKKMHYFVSMVFWFTSFEGSPPITRCFSQEPLTSS